jgi:hypothetical protein
MMYAVLSATYFFNLVTIGPFTDLLGTNLVAAEVTSTRVMLLKAVALLAAAVNLAVLGWLTWELARAALSALRDRPHLSASRSPTC